MSSSRRVRGISVVLATLAMLSLAVQPVGASVPKFGAKLAAGIDPSNSPELCDHELNGGSATYSCTWILNQAYGGGAVTAPMDGKIVAVRLISWSNGSLTPFVARKSGAQFKVVSKGSKISYGDTCNPNCSIQK